jgi:diguanylate cyclase (GGDEF)-like protein
LIGAAVGSDVAADKPDAAKSGNPAASSAALLLAEVARLKRELEESRAKLAELELRADIDPLLDILNRRGFERELKRSLAYVKRYGTKAALLYIDLDGFKAINDRHGHAAGDALLKAVAGELTAHVRASDVVARLGGDEFGVLMWNAGEPQAAACARDLEARIAALALTHGPVRLAVGASAGVAPLAGDLDAASLIDAADKAMYARKKERRG